MLTLNTMTNPIELAAELISKRSTTPSDCGCQELLSAKLTRVGFTTEWMNCNSVTNVLFSHGVGNPVFLFAGHTDVVPPGELSRWSSDPFTPKIMHGYLYGRGASDMKSAIAAFVCAAEYFASCNPKHSGTIAILLTSDEEGEAIYGTKYAIDVLQRREFPKIDYCLIGEPSSNQTVGDTIKIGRRGSLTGDLTLRGQQGHVAYPDKVDNPIHKASLIVSKMVETRWDSCLDLNIEESQKFSFPPTSIQFTKLCSDSGATNLVPAQANLAFNFRFNPNTSSESIKSYTECILRNLDNDLKWDYDLKWNLSAEPFLSMPGFFAHSLSKAIELVTGRRPSYSTSGGTSDGRFIAPFCTEIAELGLVNETIHKANECVKTEEIEMLAMIYRKVLEDLFTINL